MKPKFTDSYKYPRGYVRSEATDIARTWAAARKRIEQDKTMAEGNVRKLKQVAGSRA